MLISNKVEGHDALRDYLQSGPLQWWPGSRKSGVVTLENVYRFGELSMYYPEISSRWSGRDYVPESMDPATGLNMLTNIRNTHQPLGQFDRDSIMLYAPEAPAHEWPKMVFRTPPDSDHYERIRKSMMAGRYESTLLIVYVQDTVAIHQTKTLERSHCCIHRDG